MPRKKRRTFCVHDAPIQPNAFCRPILGKGFLSSFVALAVELVQMAVHGGAMG
jgi:hypothetical protein